LVRFLRYIHRHVSRYAPADVPCGRTQIRRNLVELCLTVTLNPKILLVDYPPRRPVALFRKVDWCLFATT